MHATPGTHRRGVFLLPLTPPSPLASPLVPLGLSLSVSCPLSLIPRLTDSISFPSLCLFLHVNLESSTEGMLDDAQAQLARY